MRTSTTNRFLTKTLRTLCCVGALTACSAWATVVTWQLNSSLGASKELSQPGYTATARGVDNTPSTDASNQYSFRSAPASAAVTEQFDLNGCLKQADVQPESRTAFSQSSVAARGQTSRFWLPPTRRPGLRRSLTRPWRKPSTKNSSRFPPSSSPRPRWFAAATDGFHGRHVDHVFGPAPVPVPEMSALFPIVGLIAAVSCTQILRRRRAAQQSSSA